MPAYNETGFESDEPTTQELRVAKAIQAVKINGMREKFGDEYALEMARAAIALILPSGDVGEIRKRHEAREHDLKFGLAFASNGEWRAHKDRATLLAALTASEAEGESEREARHKLDVALRAKDDAMQVLFGRMKAAGVDYSDLIP